MLMANFIHETYRLVGDISDDQKNSSQNGVEPYYSSLAVEVTNLLMDYIWSCLWRNTPRTKQLVETINMKPEKAAIILQINPSTVRSARSQISAILYEEFGGDVFDVIRSNNKARLEELKFRLIYKSRGYDDASNFIPKIVIDEVFGRRRVSDRSYKAKECRRELQFIAKYDVINMLRILDTLDKDKLAFLLENLLDRSTSANKFDNKSCVKGLLTMGKRIDDCIDLEFLD